MVMDAKMDVMKWMVDFVRKMEESGGRRPL
jgi:hypothetical protein